VPASGGIAMTTSCPRCPTFERDLASRRRHAHGSSRSVSVPRVPTASTGRHHGHGCPSSGVKFACARRHDRARALSQVGLDQLLSQLQAYVEADCTHVRNERGRREVIRVVGVYGIEQGIVQCQRRRELEPRPKSVCIA
jgi:hypothetical protein